MIEPEVKRCVAAGCGADSRSSPFLFFLKVPQNPERRINWCDAMGVAARRGKLYCCTRHFDIPEDFEGDSSDKAKGVRLKLKTDVLPHRNMPFLAEVCNIYSIFDHVKRTGTIDTNCLLLLPSLEQDLKIKVPLNIKQQTKDKLFTQFVNLVKEYFTKEELRSKFQLVQFLKGKREVLAEIVRETFCNRIAAGTIYLQTIQPFLTYENFGNLSLPIDKKQLEHIFFEFVPNQLKAFFRPATNMAPERNDGDFNELFFTPGVQVSLNLPFLEITRQVLSNSEMYLVSRRNPTRENDRRANQMGKMQKIDKPYRLKSSKVDQYVTLEYVDILINLFECYDFMLSQRQRKTMIFLLHQIRQELTDFEMKELQITYGNYFSKYKYYRVINEDIACNQSEHSDMYMFIKEVINPELNFQISKAITVDPDALEKVRDYFAPIFAYVDEHGDAANQNREHYLKFTEQLKKAIVYTCVDCNVSYDSVLAHLNIAEHICCGVKKRWSCANCKASFPQEEIASRLWVHEC